MPRVSAWFVRSALAYLVAGFGLGAWLLGAKGGGFPPVPAALLPAHAALLLVGWLFQCTLGVAHWILPRHAAGPERGRPWLGWAAYGLVNLGTLGLAAAGLGPGWIPTAGWLALGGAAILSVGSLAPRLKAFGAGRR